MQESKVVVRIVDVEDVIVMIQREVMVVVNSRLTVVVWLENL